MSDDTYTGRLTRTGPNTYAGRVADPWGWCVDLTLTVAEDGGDKVLDVHGVRGPVPASLYVPSIDDPL